MFHKSHLFYSGRGKSIQNNHNMHGKMNRSVTLAFHPPASFSVRRDHGYKFFHGFGSDTKTLVLCTLINTLMQDIYYQWTIETNRLMLKANSILLKTIKGARTSVALWEEALLIDGPKSHQFGQWKHCLCLAKEASVSKVPEATVG